MTMKNVQDTSTQDKSENELEIRLRLFQPVKGSLPEEVIKASRVFDKAGQVYNKALSDNMPVLEVLHAVECTNCPWDGETIFPGT